MDGRLDPIPIGGPYQDCLCKAGKGVKGEPREAKCSDKILTAPGHAWNERTRTMTLWEHEVAHAKYFVDRFKKTVAAIDIAARWCVPEGECQEIRSDYVQSIIGILQTENLVRDFSLHAKDYLGEAQRAEAGVKAKRFEEMYNRELKEIGALATKLMKCLEKNRWAEPPTKWPTL
jgi:hypothetical protein